MSQCSYRSEREKKMHITYNLLKK